MEDSKENNPNEILGVKRFIKSATYNHTFMLL